MRRHSMKGQNTFTEESANAEQILGVMRDYQRLELGVILRGEEILSFDSTVKDWLASFDVYEEWRFFGKFLNKVFQLNIGQQEWQTILRPEGQKKLREVCEFVALRATLPRLNEQRILGGNCRNGSAFLGLRYQLQQKGVVLGAIRPSSKLGDYLRLHSDEIISTIIRVAPGKMPAVKWRNNLGSKISGCFFLASILALGFASAFSKPAIEFLAVLCVALSFLAATAFSKLPPKSVSIEGCETFADLSRLIATG